MICALGKFVMVTTYLLYSIDSSTGRDDPRNSDIEMIMKGYVTIKVAAVVSSIKTSRLWFQWIEHIW